MKEDMTFLSTNHLNDFLNSRKKVKYATAKENKELFLRYQSGNIEVKNEIIERNIGLVISIVSKKYKNIKEEEKMDYIQNGIIGLIEAIDKFDLNKDTAFSTYAEYQINMRILRYRYNNQKLIRRPEYLINLKNKYRKIIEEYEKSGIPLPSKEEICTMLDIQMRTLIKLEEDYKLEAISLDSPSETDDNDSNSLDIYIGREDQELSSLFDNIVIEEILKTLKMTISNCEYYIIYHRIISSEKKTFREIGEHLGIDTSSVQYIEKKVKSKIRKMFNDDFTLKRNYLDEIKRNYSFENIKITPCQVENYTMYFYLRDKLKEKDQTILKELLLSNLIFDNKKVAKEINESEKYVKEKQQELIGIIKRTINDIDYILFHKNLLKKYKNEILSLELDTDLEDCLNTREIIINYWKDKTLEEIIELADRLNFSYDDKLIQKINSIYGIYPKKRVSYEKEVIERDVNYSLFGFAVDENYLEELYPIFLKNQDKFTPKQREHINSVIFKKNISNQEDRKDSQYYNESLINKLFLLLYEVEDYRQDNFTASKYLTVRDECIRNLDEKSIKLLDYYYGINGDKITIKKMAELLGETEEEIEKTFKKAKYFAINTYLGSGQYYFDKEIYKKVLQEEEFVLKDPHLSVAEMFFIEDKSYKEIAKIKDISQRRVSELIKYACNLMDYYRFGINSTRRSYSKELLLDVLEKSKFDDETKDIMKTLIETKSITETAKKYQKNVSEISNISKRLNNKAEKALIEGVELTKEDIEKVILEHDSINVLNEREKTILSLLYGLKNKYNSSGKRKYPIDIGELLGIKEYNIVVRNALKHVKARKIGLAKTALDFVERKELENILRDKRIPLEEEEKNIIINAYGLYNTQYLTIKEIAEKYGYKDAIARQKLYRGIITIKKYLNNEIKGKVLFEIDIKPYLKYFTIDDREILTALYKEKKTQLEIEAEKGLSTHQFGNLFQKIQLHLNNLQSKEAAGIDFDYFWNNAKEKDIPYYNNQELAIELCFRYYEERLSKSDILRLFHSELGHTAIGEIIKSFTLAVIKHQKGFKKINDFSYEEIANHYNSHEDELGEIKKKKYQIYFAKSKKNGPYVKIRPGKLITYDLIKEKYPNYFQLKTTNPDQVREILGKYGQTLSKNTIKTLESLFGVTHPNLLNDKDWEEVINFLGPLQLINEQSENTSYDILLNNNAISNKKYVKK